MDTTTQRLTEIQAELSELRASLVSSPVVARELIDAASAELDDAAEQSVASGIAEIQAMRAELRAAAGIAEDAAQVARSDRNRWFTWGAEIIRRPFRRSARFAVAA